MNGPNAKTKKRPVPRKTSKNIGKKDLKSLERDGTTRKQ